MTIISDRTFNYRIITPSLPVGKKKSLYSYVLNSQNTFPPHTHTKDTQNINENSLFLEKKNVEEERNKDKS